MNRDGALIVCVPLSVGPNLPKEATYSTYEKVACPECGEDMWLGAQSKRVRDEGGVACMCMLCATRIYGNLMQHRTATLT